MLALLSVAVTLVAYAAGLHGPFLFDDHVHITQNRWVKIEAITLPDLVQAWNSSLSPFPNDRPLAQLTFGINHALSGLSPWAFKATNLAIHLVNGLFVFLLARLGYRAVRGNDGTAVQERWFALTAAALWLLHPLHVSTVLYTVQRMAQLSTLSLLAALCCYYRGRIEIAGGRPGAVWILAAVPIAMLGFLAKENTVLLPLLLLASELTLLAPLPTASRIRFMRIVWLLLIAFPIVAALGYFATHAWILNFDGRPFTLEERLLTQARVLWLYLQWLSVPDITAFGLFHDDIATSAGLTSPPTTLLSLAGLLVLATAAVVWRRKWPFFSFAVLFFLAGHAIESTVLPLEMVFEHRNYLPSIGPFFLLAHLIVSAAGNPRLGRVARLLGISLLLSYASLTYLRVDNWSSLENFILASAENHPGSTRANFLAAQMLIAKLDEAGPEKAVLAGAARTFLLNGLTVDPRCINCLFGILVLDLHLDRPPEKATVTLLADALRTGYVGASNASISQFSYLVKWQQSDGLKLDRAGLEAVFDAALANPGWNHTGRAGIEAAYREYHEMVTQDLEAALRHARAAVDAWPDQWSYHMQLVRLLLKLGRDESALAALDRAEGLAGNDAQRQEMIVVRARIGNSRVN